MFFELEPYFNRIGPAYAANFERVEKWDIAVTKGREEKLPPRNLHIADRPLD